MSVQVHDRKFAPLPWQASRDRVAADCQWSHRDLAVAFPGWGFNGQSSAGLFTGAPVESLTDPFWPARRQICFARNGMGMRGRTYEVTAGSSFNTAPTVAVYSPDVPNFPTGPASVVLHYRKLDATNRQAVMFAMNGNGVTDYLHAFTNTSGHVVWDYGGSAAGNRLTVTGLTFGDDVWVFTVGARGQEMWQNGVLRGSNANNPTRVNSANRWGLFAGVIWTSDFAESGALLLYNRQLEYDAIQALTTDPWTPFRPARRARYAVVGAAPGSGARVFVPGFIG
jgi:hypothetical protein